MWVSVPPLKGDPKTLTANPTLVPLLSDSVSFLSPLEQSAAAAKVSHLSLISSLYGISLRSVASSALALYQLLVKLAIVRLK